MKRRFDSIVAFFSYTVLTAVATYPMLFRMGSSFPGSIAGDTPGTIWLTWWFKNAYRLHVSPAFAKTISYPYGIHISAMQVSPMQKWLLPWLSMATNEVFAYNLVVFASFPLAGLGMYLLVKHITGNKGAAFASGLIFAFSPYQILESSLHLTLANIQWMPFYVLFLIKAYKDRDIKDSALAGLFFSLNALMDFHYGLFMAFFTAMFLAYKVAEALIERKVKDLGLDIRTLKAAVVFIIICLVILGPSMYQSMNRFQTGAVPSRPIEEIDLYSMKLWDLVIPPSTTPIVGPVIKKIAMQVYGQDRPYQPNYLGWLPLLLAATGVVLARKESITRFMAIFAVASFILALGVFLKVDGVAIPLPWLWIHRFIPWVRVVSRFTVAILLALSVLSGIALKSISDRIKTAQGKTAFFAVIIVLIVFEYSGMFNYPVVTFGDKGKTSLSSRVYEKVRTEKGDFSIIEYPMLYEPNQYIFMQRVHRKNLVNGVSNVAGDGYAAMTERLKTVDSIDLTDEQYKLLQRVSVKYILVHDMEGFDARSFRRGNVGKHTRFIMYDKGVWLFELIP